MTFKAMKFGELNEKGAYYCFSKESDDSKAEKFQIIAICDFESCADEYKFLPFLPKCNVNKRK